MNVQVCFLVIWKNGYVWLVLIWDVFRVAGKNYFSRNLNDYVLYLHLKFSRYRYITFFEYSFQFCAEMTASLSWLHRQQSSSTPTGLQVETFL